jgi:2-polyprenyl-6-methoxyphenol hydroxylase-like FAD-dependent oxidoreductase
MEWALSVILNAMKFCIYGAGAIGGYLAVELASAGHDVCVIAWPSSQFTHRFDPLYMIGIGACVLRSTFCFV